MENEKINLIAAIVENKPGVLYSVSNMFRRRGFNIESISVGPVEQADLARMTIAVKSDEKTLEQLIKQLNKLIDVVKVSRLNPTNIVTREVALVKVNIPRAEAGSDIVTYLDVFGGRIVDVSLETLVIEIAGESDRINAFVDVMKNFGIKELGRTGVTALSRGSECVRVEEQCGENEK